MIGELKQQRLVDDDGSDDVAKKNSLCPFKLYRVCSDPLNFSNVGNVVDVFFFFSSWWLLRACLHGGGGPQVGEVTPLSIKSLILF